MTLASAIMPRRLAVASIFALAIFCAAGLFAEDAAEPIAAPIPDVWKRPPAGPLAIDEGVVWFRAVVRPPSGWADEEVELFVEAVDDARQIFVNGQRVGVLGTFPPEFRSGLGQSHRLAIPPGTLLAGEPNVVAIRVFHYHGRRGFNVAAPVLFGPDAAIPMAGPWQAFAADEEAIARLSTRFDVPESEWFETTMPIDEAEQELRRLADDAGPLPPAEAVERLRTVDDLELDLVLADPVIGQPLSMKWDHRGRLWLVEYLQYPDPAGLTAVSRDQFLRTVWDRQPAPPPHHFAGADRISVHEDTNGDGVYDSHHVFLEGLSLATSVALDRDGVWVLNPPHLLFYSDRDGDGIADGDPEVHLEGFGLEDSHSLANSLRWGPDGWLYGAQGSTVSAEIRRSGSSDDPVRSIGQLIWRYHPSSGRYEVFAEGGGNAFGVEIDSAGRIFSGHNGGDTRGFHYLPGGYYRKGFGKHGELSNPYAFGFFEAMGHHRAERFTHTFVIQESDSLPSRFRGHLFGVEPLQGRVVLSRMEPDGSSFKTTDVEHVLWSDGDTWFRPVDIQEGPDGSLYVADFYEQRIDHASHAQGRIHRESGRIYRLRGPDTPGSPALPGPEDLGGWIDRLGAPIRWQRQTAIRRVIALADDTTPSKLRKLVAAGDPEAPRPARDAALSSLWVLGQMGGFDEDWVLEVLSHRNAELREWMIRFVGEAGSPADVVLDRLVELGRHDPDQHVRLELAATARRLAVGSGLAVIEALIGHPAAAEDDRLPLMLWWAIETQVSRDAEAVVRWWTGQPSLWRSEVARRDIAERLMRRFAAAGSRRDLMVCASLLRAAPDRDAGQRLLAGFEAAFRGRSLASLPDDLVDAMTETGGGSLPLRVRRGDPEAIAETLQVVTDRQQKNELRVEYLRLIGDVRPAAAGEAILDLATTGDESESVRLAALTALEGYDAEVIAERIVEMLGRVEGPIREAALSLLASRTVWARQLLGSITAGEIAAESVPDAVVRKIHLHRDEAIRADVAVHWGSVSGVTTAEMEADIDRFRSLIGSGIGNPRVGKKLFTTHCGVCHQLFGEGGKSGPDLTSYQRQDVRSMVTHIVNPGLEIREGFENYLVLTDDGRAINGLIADSDRQVVVIRDASGQTRTIAREEILELGAVPQSLMPVGLLDSLGEQQIRDLFAYLRSPQPVP